MRIDTGNNIGEIAMNIDVTEIIALFAQLAGPAFSVAFVLALGLSWCIRSCLWALMGGLNYD